MSSSFSAAGDLLTLAKVRVNALVVATTAGGYVMAGPARIDISELMIACLGTALVAAGAAAVNQIDERHTDGLMQRTRTRPVASGRIGVPAARAFAYGLTAAGLLILVAYNNPTAALVALATFMIYTSIYTPLKLRTSLSTIVGAVPGALPPLIGWAAAGGSLTEAAPWTLFLIMFTWQLPHFLAIAWIYRVDYGRAGLKMLSVVDRTGGMAGRQATLWAVTLVLVSVLPAVVGLVHVSYVIGALLLGTSQVALAFMFLLRRSDASARVLFYASITYLPMLWVLMAMTRT